jgi:hypothetical protein
MARETKRKQLHYRRATFLKPTGRPLQELIEEALSKLTPVKLRFEHLKNVSPDETWRRFINTHRAALGMQFGNLVLYASEQNRAIIAIDDNADELDIEQIAPPTSNDGRRREFLESILYYGVKQNHVVLLQSMSLRARELELHLNWLLREANLIDQHNAVFLNNFAPQMTHEKLEQAEVKSVKLGTPLFDYYDEIIEPMADSKSVKKRFKPFGEGIEILKPLVGNRIADLSWDELEASSNLEVFVEITYKRQTDSGSQKLLNRLTTALRHAGDDDIRIELKDGGVVVGSDLQIKSFKGIAAYNGMLDPQDVFLKMSEWLLENLERGIIDAE